jgi:hypothetical protein
MDKTLLNVNDKIIASDKAGEALLYRDRIATDSGTLLTFDETEAYATATWDEATSSPDIVVVNKNYAMRKIRLELTPTTKTLFVNDVQVDSQTGTYTWQPITEIELGHFNGEEQVEFEIKNLRIK